MTTSPGPAARPATGATAPRTPTCTGSVCTDGSVNLACSGARAADVARGGAAATARARRRSGWARWPGQVRVTAVVLQVGGNDDPALVPTGIACIRAFLDPAVPGCRDTVGPQWPARLAAMAPKVEAAVADVRAAMRRAGYTDTGYTLVLASYAAPLTERMIGVPAAQGCPYSRAGRRVGAHGGVPPAVADPAQVAADARGAVPRPVAGDRGPRGVQPGARRRGVAAPADRRPERPGLRRARRVRHRTSRRSRSIRRPPGTRSWAAASGSSCAAARCRPRPAGWGRTGTCTPRRPRRSAPASAA